MKALSSPKERGPSGPAKVTVAGKRVTVTMLDANGQETFQTYSFPVEEMPHKVPTGKYFVSISTDGTKFYQVRPLSGMYICEVKGIGNSGNAARGQAPSLPIPKHVTGERQGPNGPYPVDEQTFLVVASIVEGPFEGIEIPCPFLYFRKSKTGTGGSGFVEDEEGNVAVRGSGKAIEKLVSFLEATNLWDHEFHYSDNILPALEAALKKAGSFVIILSKGWPDTYSPSPKKLTRKVAAKKTAKKKKG